MQANSKTLGRFFSVPHGHNQSNISNENDNTTPVPRSIEHFQPRIKEDQPPRKNFLRQISLIAEQKIDQLEENAQDVSNALHDSKFTQVTFLCEDEPNKNDIVISSIAPDPMVETCLTFHRDIKPGKQWFRWNLLFNLIIWLIVPLPFWIPFASNRVAYYMMPSIQGVFVAMWISECALSSIFQIAFSFI
jgi:hypothetical protein